MSARTRAAATVLIAFATLGLLSVLPTYRSQTCYSDRYNQPVCASDDSRTLQEESGRGVLLVLSVPTAVALVGVIRPRRNVLLGVAIVLSVVLLPAMLTVGIFFAPTALVAWLVFADADRRRERASGTWR